MIDVAELGVVPGFGEVPRPELEFFAAQLEPRDLAAGERYYTQGEPSPGLQIVLRGLLQLVRREGGEGVGAYLLEPGEMGGRLPFSRMRVQGTSAVAVSDTRVGELAAERFPDLQAHAPTILELLVHEMLDRTQEYTRMGAQREKLMSLGTMAAGLAHEINNPASAARRAAQNLQGTLAAFDRHSSRILSTVLFREPPGGEDPFGPLYAAMTLDGDNLNPLERADREDELGEWLEDRGVADALDVAATLVSGGLDKTVMQETTDALVPEQVTNFLGWVPHDVELRLLAKELAESTVRISDLVGAMKAYSYMDQGLDKQEVDLREGIVNTLMILKHRLHKKDLRLVKEFGDAPKITAYGGELNQVWTNLLSNAIDAAPEGGTVTVRLTHDRAAEALCVDVIDDGPGVPAELQGRIFEPFFTTKGVGEGTGMGLDIANRIVRVRHRGTLQLTSRPGYTCFQVRLPL